jgi:hypothetical protein
MAEMMAFSFFLEATRRLRDVHEFALHPAGASVWYRRPTCTRPDVIAEPLAVSGDNRGGRQLSKVP